METFIQSVETHFETFVRLVILLLECLGVVTLIGSALRAVTDMFRKREPTRLKLAEGISLALEFKLGSEVLRSVLVRSLDELIVLGAVVVLRAAITFLLHWEIKTEQKAMAVRDGGSR